MNIQKMLKRTLFCEDLYDEDFLNYLRKRNLTKKLKSVSGFSYIVGISYDKKKEKYVVYVTGERVTLTFLDDYDNFDVALSNARDYYVGLCSSIGSNKEESKKKERKL